MNAYAAITRARPRRLCCPYCHAELVQARAIRVGGVVHDLRRIGARDEIRAGILEGKLAYVLCTTCGRWVAREDVGLSYDQLVWRRWRYLAAFFAGAGALLQGWRKDP